MLKRSVEGSPYSAQLIGQEDHTQAHSYAYAIVEPPFSADEATFDIAFYRGAKVTPLVTTTTKTLLEIDVPEANAPSSHEARLKIAYSGLSNLINYLNQIENGTFEHY